MIPFARYRIKIKKNVMPLIKKVKMLSQNFMPGGINYEEETFIKLG